MNFLYWNINKKNIIEPLIKIVVENSIDVIILSEINISQSELLEELNKNLHQKFSLSYSPINDPLILARLPRNSVEIVHNSNNISIRKIKPPLGCEFLLYVVHLPSKLHQNTEDQILNSTEVIRIIEEFEDKMANRRSIIVGDFNMNPFEYGVIGASGFHAILDKEIAKRGSRVVGRQKKHFFYNPMWKQYSNVYPKVPGTYYYNKSTQINYFWNIFDQVLIRPELLHIFDENQVAILTEFEGNSLLNNKQLPNSEKFSDHLPIKFSLDLFKEV